MHTTNAEPVTPTCLPQAEVAVSDPQLSVLNPSSSAPAQSRKHRRNGNIAKLPKVLRDRINAFLDDGLTYKQIREQLEQSTDPPLPYPISEMNISRWYDGGYQDHLARHDRLDLVRANREAAQDLIADGDTATLPEATLQIIASHYYEVLDNFAPVGLKAKLAEDPMKYPRFVNAFARLNREILLLKKHREASANAHPVEPKTLDPDRDLSDNEYQLLVNKWDQVFKIRRRRVAAGVPPAVEPGVPPGGFSVPPQKTLKSRPQAPNGTSSEGGPAAPHPSDRERVAPQETPAPEQTRFAPDPPSAAIVHAEPSVQGPPVPLSITPPPARTSPFPPEHCPHCKALLPPRPPNGIRPDLTCGLCRNPLPFLPMVGTQPPEFCPQCDLLLPSLLSDGQRPSPSCRCGALLPAPGLAAEQKADHCIECAARLPAPLPSGERPAQHCPGCGSSLPPPPPQSTWVSHYCLFCGTRLHPNALTRHRIRDNCANCGCPLPPVGGSPPPATM